MCIRDSATPIRDAPAIAQLTIDSPAMRTFEGKRGSSTERKASNSTTMASKTRSTAIDAIEVENGTGVSRVSTYARATAIGMMVNNVVPARAGEVARAYVLTRETPVPFSTSIASIAVDRVFDAIVVLLLAFLSVLDPRFPSNVRIAGESIVSWAIAGASLIGVAVVVFYALVFFPAPLIRLFELFARRLSPRLEERGRAALITFSEGLSVLRSPRHFAAVMGWTIAHWLMNALGWWIAMLAVGIHAPFSAALLLQAMVALGVAVPAAPGYFGIFEKVAVLGLAIYSVSASLATSWALGFHILSFLPITIFGAVYAARLNLNLKDLQSQHNAA